ncbi:MAG: flavin reductase [Xanthobacteraceae bacterium]|jgi:flavin reductase (DIM6/NTAB) family NADH-FMN oxidoreductase RutF
MSWIDQRPDDAMDGAFAAVSPTPFDTVDSSVFREAMSRLGAAVHVVTTDGPAGKGGFTATAVCSVSDSPATLLACLNRRSQSTQVFPLNGVLCVNTLGADQEAVATMFSGRTGISMAERFSGPEWIYLKTGCPVLATAVVAFDCRIIEVKAVATHNVLIAGIEAIHLGPGGPALVYHDRAYKRV